MKEAVAIILTVLFLVLGNRIVDGHYRRAGARPWSLLDGLHAFPLFRFDRMAWRRMGLLVLGYLSAGALVIEYL